MINNAAEKRDEGGISGFEPAKAEHEVIEGGLQMFAARVVLDSHASVLEVGERPADGRHDVKDTIVSLHEIMDGDPGRIEARKCAVFQVLSRLKNTAERIAAA